MLNKFNSSLLHFALVCLCSLLAFFGGCSRGPSQPATTSSQFAAKRYSLKGRVISIHKEAGIAIIDNDAVPGFMDAMIMPYIIKPASSLDQLQPGDSISADVIIERNMYWLENVKVTGHSQTRVDKPTATLHISSDGANNL
jgi:protein SCO1/2